MQAGLLIMIFMYVFRPYTRVRFLLFVFSERELMFMFAICRRASVRLSVCLSVCLSVMFVHPT